MFLYDPSSDDEPNGDNPKEKTADAADSGSEDEEHEKEGKKKFGHRIKNKIDKVKEKKRLKKEAKM